MRKHLFAFRLILLVGFTFFSLSAFAQNNYNLIVNGSFEEEGPDSDYITLKQGAHILGWNVFKGTIDINAGYFKAQDGK